jgi:hypothetical protein
MKKGLIFFILSLFLSSCWFGGVKKPDSPVPVAFAGIVNSPDEFTNISSMNKNKVEQTIQSLVNGSGFFSIRKNLAKDRILSPEDTSVFLQDSTIRSIFQLRLKKEGFLVERKTIIPYVANKPRLKHVWEFEVYIWNNGSKNFTFSGTVKSEITIATHIDVIDYDANDPSLVIPAPERERVRRRSLEKFVGELIKRMIKYVPGEKK